MRAHEQRARAVLCVDGLEAKQATSAQGPRLASAGELERAATQRS
jgi:hypothetical protein